MKPEVLLFAVGGLLLVAGLVGGGLEMRELKIPPIGRFARFCATGVGAICILLGIGVVAAERPDNAVAKQERKPVHFTVTDELWGPQVAEDVSLIIDGHNTEGLHVDENDDDSSIPVEATEGRHDYQLMVNTTELGDDGEYVERQATGQGTIVVREGATYHLEYADNGTSRDVVLVEG
jgi:hypothetical protein